MSLLSLSTRLSRREFLKLGGFGLGALILLPLAAIQQAELSGQQGRVLDAVISLYDRPSKEGKVVKYVWRDLVLPITAVTLGDDTGAFNRVWYQIGKDGYAYSGGIQPVELKLNEPGEAIPEMGKLVEVTVPYTDARRQPDAAAPLSYRLYYATTHWVVSLTQDVLGATWYGIWDEKIKNVYYAPGRHLRLVPDEELQMLSPQVPAEAKHIEVHLGEQMVVAYEYDQPVFMTRAATGARFSSGNYETPRGSYVVQRKRPARHMAAGDRAAPNSYDLPGVPWVCYFTEDGISLHGTYWHNDFGKPRSHGCVNLSTQAAKWIYRWTTPVVPARESSVFEDGGTRIEVV
ncbi:MAG: L,D-transpeptidase [Chloroflexi bacterium]|nr:L,D-transpeptidase [Chloroflexota bacterium]